MVESKKSNTGAKKKKMATSKKENIPTASRSGKKSTTSSKGLTSKTKEGGAKKAAKATKKTGKSTQQLKPITDFDKLIRYCQYYIIAAIMVRIPKNNTKWAKLILLANFRSKSMVSKPKTKEVINPANSSGEAVNLSKLRIILPPKTMGKLKRKLSSKAILSLNFLKSKAETVNPERESPGKVAKLCTIPKNMPSPGFASLNPFNF